MSFDSWKWNASYLQIFLLICLGWGIELSASEKTVIEYEASYLGISLLDMTLTWEEDDSTVQVSYDNQLKPFIAFFHPIHNVYRVQFLRDSFQPLNWSKSISEGQLSFELGALRSDDGSSVSFSEGSSLAFPEGAFTIFSATHYLAEKAREPAFFPKQIQVFIDGTIWEATASRYDTSHPHPDHKIKIGEVLIQADLHYIRGESLLKKNDILTSVIATEGTRFLLWVMPDGTYTRAQFGSFPAAVVLERIN